VHHRDQLQASKIMQDRAFANDKIDFRWNAKVVEVNGDNKLAGLTIEDTVTGEREPLDVTGLFVAIGHRPNTDLFLDAVDADENGYILTGRDGRQTATNIDGVFACGDVQDATHRQAITAAGSGCEAALDAERWLEDQGIS